MNVIITDVSVWLGVVVGGGAVLAAVTKWLERRMTAAVARATDTLKQGIADDLRTDLGALPHIRSQLSPNHGTSALDKINATVGRLDRLESTSAARFDSIETAITGVRSAVDTLTGAFHEHTRAGRTP